MKTSAKEEMPMVVCIVIPVSMSEFARIKTSVGTIIIPSPTPINEPMMEDINPIIINTIIAIVPHLPLNKELLLF